MLDELRSGRLNRSRRTGPRPTGHIVPKCTGTACWASSSARNPAARVASRCPDPNVGPQPPTGSRAMSQRPTASRTMGDQSVSPAKYVRAFPRTTYPRAGARRRDQGHRWPSCSAGTTRRRHPPRGPCRPGRPRPVHGRAAVAARAQRAVRRPGPPPERVAAGRKVTRGGDGRRADATQRPDLRSGTCRRAAAPVAGAGAPASAEQRVGEDTNTTVVDRAGRVPPPGDVRHLSSFQIPRAR